MWVSVTAVIRKPCRSAAAMYWSTRRLGSMTTAVPAAPQPIR